jgi:RHS repeat-associated protein
MWTHPAGTDPVYKFTGKERDAESGLDNFGARYDASSLGRFMTPDEPFADQSVRDPQSWNLYSYVRNNPANNTDPTGSACVDGKDDGSPGESCAQVEQNNKRAQPAATVTATDPILDVLGQAYQRGGAITQPGFWVAWTGASAAAGGLGAYGYSFYEAAGYTQLTTIGLGSGSLAGLLPEEQEIAEELIAAGKTVIPIARSAEEKTADFLVNGISTELKTITQLGPNTVKNAIETAAKQGVDIIINARRTGLTPAQALVEIQRAQGNIGTLIGRVTVLTKSGPVKF